MNGYEELVHQLVRPKAIEFLGYQEGAVGELAVGAGKEEGISQKARWSSELHSPNRVS